MKIYNCDKEFNNKIINRSKVWMNLSKVWMNLSKVWMSLSNFFTSIVCSFVFHCKRSDLYLLYLYIGGLIGYPIYLLCSFIGLTNVLLITSTGYNITISMLVGSFIGLMVFLKMAFSRKN